MFCDINVWREAGAGAGGGCVEGDRTAPEANDEDTRALCRGGWAPFGFGGCEEDCLGGGGAEGRGVTTEGNFVGTLMRSFIDALRSLEVPRSCSPA